MGNHRRCRLHVELLEDRLAPALDFPAVNNVADVELPVAAQLTAAGNLYDSLNSALGGPLRDILGWGQDRAGKWPPSFKTVVSRGTAYELNADHQLLRRTARTSWQVIDEGVQSFQVAPNGDLYLLNDRHELRRLQAGYSWSTLREDVQTFVMDARGTVYALDQLGGLWLYRSIKRYWLLPSIPEGDGFFGAQDPPDYTFILRAASIPVGQSPPQFFAPSPVFPFRRELAELRPNRGPGPDAPGKTRLPKDPVRRFSTGFSDIQIVTERVQDTLDEPRVFPRAGLAQLHHVQWRCTIYYSNFQPVRPEVQVITIDMSHLHRYVPSMGSTSKPASLAAGLLSRSSVSLESLSVPETRVQSLTRGPDGTIYKLGAGHSEHSWVGTDPSPRTLWRLAPGSVWKPVFELYHHDLITSWPMRIAPDGTVFKLSHHQLLKRSPGSDQWSVLETQVRWFAMAPDGTVYAINAADKVRRLLPGARRLTTIATLAPTGAMSLPSFTMAADGTIYLVDSLHQLRRLEGRDQWTVLDSNATAITNASRDGTITYVDSASEVKFWQPAHRVYSFAVAPDQTLFALNSDHELRRQLRGSRRWTTLAVDIQAFTMTLDGTVYALDGNQELRQLPPGATTWITLDVGVQCSR